MGANVECNGYLRDFYSFRDLFLGTEHSRWNICNDSSGLRSSGQYDHSLSSLSPDYLLGHHKEVLKQTMLKHEAIFRGQIEELHRLYWKQKTLTEELRRSGMCPQFVREGLSQSSSLFSHVPYEKSRNPYQSRGTPWSKAGSQSTTGFVQSGGIPTSTNGLTEDCKSVEHKFRKVGKKVLDLQLPACEYVDSDEEESLVDRKMMKASVVPLYHEKPSLRNNILYSSPCKHVFGPGPILRTSAGLADLNEPINPEEELAPRFGDLLDPINLENMPFDDSSRPKFGYRISSENLHLNCKASQEIGSCSSNVPLFNKDRKLKLVSSTSEVGINEENSFLPSLSASKELDLKSRDNGVDINTLYAPNIGTLLFAPHQTAAQAHLIDSISPPIDNIIETSSCARGQYAKLPEHVTMSKGLDLNVVAKENPTVKQTLPETIDIKDSEEVVVHNLNLSAASACKSGKGVPSDEILLKSKHKDIQHAFDLNSCASEDDCSLEDSELQAPESPENKESSPPRGESDQLELSSHLLEQEDAGLQVEEISMAAKVLASIAMCPVEKCLNTSCTPPTCKSSSSDSLYWFAEIVDRVEADPNDSSNVNLTDEVGGTEEFLPYEVDEFEAMTLELRETIVEDCFCITNELSVGESAPTYSPFQARKSRSRRGRKQKDFQREILPSLASLSKCEVTEDLQLIEGLLETAGPRIGKICLSSSGRSGLFRGKKRSASSIMNDNALDFTTGQPTSSNNELSIEKSCLVGWGKITRKRRGQRYSAQPIIE